VLDKEARSFVPLRLYSAQAKIAAELVAGGWIWLLKARRLGATTIILAYVLWRMIFHPQFNADILSRKKVPAKGLLRMLKLMFDNPKQKGSCLPEWMRPGVTKDNETEWEFDNGSTALVIVGGEDAARSEGLDFVLADEAAYVRNLGPTLDAAQPTLETSSLGQCAVVSTANGPGDDFHWGYKAAKEGRTRYKPVFLAWWERDGRTQEWYDCEAKENSHRYASNDQECFEAARGRVYPMIERATHWVHKERPRDALCYRALDFGTAQAHPFVCVWLWHKEDAPPSLTFEPDCEIVHESELARGKYAWGLEEFFAYKRDEENLGKIIKEQDHIPDALRYAVTHWEMTGEVHVYRVLVIRSDDERPAQPLAMFHEVLRLSGWMPFDVHGIEWVPGPDVEEYAGTVGDRSGSSWISMAREQVQAGHFSLSIVPHRKPLGFTGDEVEGGITWVSALAAGKVPHWKISRHKRDSETVEEMIARGEPPRYPDERMKWIWAQVRGEHRPKRSRRRSVLPWEA
jgi:hypothetical protein